MTGYPGASGLDGDRTRWSLIQRARGEGPEARRALGELVRRYDRTVDRRLRHLRCPPDRTPDDLKAEFLSFFVFQGVHRVNSLRGRFRPWLNRQVGFFVQRQWRAWYKLQGGHRITDSVDTRTLEMESNEENGEEHCLRAEALDLFDAAIALHRRRAPDKRRFELLLPFISRREPEVEEFETLAQKLGIGTNAVSAAIIDLKERHAKMLHEVVADDLNVDPKTAEGRREIRAELRSMQAILSRRDEKLTWPAPARATVPSRAGAQARRTSSKPRSALE